MTYVMSDLHGRYDLYLKMLDRISFGADDRLYILGDLVDRGSEGLKIVLDVAARNNVACLMGNHDLLSSVILTNLDKGLKPGQMEDMRHIIDAWRADGGIVTYNEYKRLSPGERKLALMAIDSFQTYADVKVGAREYVLCHGGIRDYSEDRPLSDYTIEDIAFYREDYSKPKFTKKDRYLVTGHTPTAAIEGGVEGRIYKNHDHIAIDCGAAFGYGLGCLCLDTMEEFYVK